MIRIIRANEAADRIGVSTTTLWRWQRAGIMPRPRSIGPNVRGWVEAELDDWIESRPAGGAEAAATVDGADEGR